MSKHSIARCVCGLLSLSTLTAYAGSVETITVTTAGTLKSQVMDLESVTIDELTIHGNLNGADIAYIISGTGRMANIKKLDLSDVKLVASDEIPYRTKYQIAQSDVGGGGTYGTFYISETNRREFSSSSSTGLGGDNDFYNIYTNNLEAAFADCGAFKEVVLPRGLTEVGDMMFRSSSVESVVIPESATRIGCEAFSKTTSLGAVTLPDGITCIDNYAFDRSAITSVNIPEACTTIGAYAFHWCKRLACAIDLSGVEQIGEYAFCECPLQGTLDLRKITDIPDGAFTGRRELELGEYGGEYYVYLDNITSVLFSDKLESIGAAAFRETSVKEFNIPSSVKRVGPNAFTSTPWMKTLQKEDGIIYGGPIVFGIDLTSDLAKDDAITTIKFKDGTTVIADFYDSRLKTTKFKEVILPESLCSIGDKCFYNFTGLESLVLPKNLEYIGNHAFWNCKSLKELTMPELLRHIGQYAFHGSTLTRVFLPDGLETIDNNAFSGSNTIAEASFGRNLKSAGYSIFDSNALVRVTYNAIALEGDLNLGGLSGLEKLIVGNEVTVLPDNFMNNNKNLAIVEFAQGRNENQTLRIGNKCFEGCEQATFRNLPRKLSLGENAFRSCKQLNINLEEFEITSSCNNYAFAQCIALKGSEWTLGNEVDYLGFGIFDESQAPIRTINYNCNVGEIDHYGYFYLPYGSFTGLDQLSRINIGKDVNVLPATVFKGVPACNIYLYASVPPSASDGWLGNVSDCTLFVPAQYFEDYSAAYPGAKLKTFDGGDSSVDEIVSTPFAITVTGLDITITGMPEGSPVSLLTISGTTAAQSVTPSISAPTPGLYLLAAGNNTVKLYVH